MCRDCGCEAGLQEIVRDHAGHHHAHAHVHSHGHDHDHIPGHDHEHEREHEHEHEHDHTHVHDHDHAHHDHDHTPVHDHAHDHTHAHDHAHDHTHAHDHDHTPVHDHAHEHTPTPVHDHAHDHTPVHDHAHDHTQAHAHDHHACDHDHGHLHVGQGDSAGHPHHPHVGPQAHPIAKQHSGERTLYLETKVLAKNNAIAEANRRWLASRNIMAINLISSPGAGKTLLLERTLEYLQGRVPCAVIVGDLQTDRDARRLQGKGAPVHQIETINSCHLDAGQVGRLLPRVVPEGTRLLIIENVGNLVCPAAFDLGEHLKIALLSVTEGEDKPLKYPTLFHQAPVVVITKVDLVPHLTWDMNLCVNNIQQVRPDAKIMALSARQGTGMDAWLQFLEQSVA